jgi:hypothetical protein
VENEWRRRAAVVMVTFLVAAGLAGGMASGSTARDRLPRMLFPTLDYGHPSVPLLWHRWVRPRQWNDGDDVSVPYAHWIAWNGKEARARVRVVIAGKRGHGRVRLSDPGYCAAAHSYGFLHERDLGGPWGRGATGDLTEPCEGVGYASSDGGHGPLERSAGASTIRVTSGGRIGPLRLDHSGKPEIVAFAGEPEVDETSSGDLPNLGWEALGYGCGQTDTRAPLVATAGPEGPYCRTVYYVNLETKHLGTFFTSRPNFRDAHGVSVGTRTAQAARREGAPALAGCLEGIGISTPTAMFHLVISGGHMHSHGNKLLVRGGRVGALVLHSRQHDVGVFDCW